MQDQRSYRPNVGICLFHRNGLVFMGQLPANPTGSPDPEMTAPEADWGVPQGGIDRNEDLVAAALRELYEETGVSSVAHLATTPEWWSYDFPKPPNPSHKLGPFRGQTQRYVALRFLGDDREIRIDAAHTHEPAEFIQWAWRPLADLPSIGLLHRRESYRKLVSAFSGIGPA